jgi:hypothetical protein
MRADLMEIPGHPQTPVVLKSTFALLNLSLYIAGQLQHRSFAYKH